MLFRPGRELGSRRAKRGLGIPPRKATAERPKETVRVREHERQGRPVKSYTRAKGAG